MFFEDPIEGRAGQDLAVKFEHDLNIIRRDIVSVLQETAHVRASMTKFSSSKPAVSKRFIVLSGVVCFMLMVALILFQVQLQAWFSFT
ncbi:hypothetical protein [Lichenifustis flavocetrariae]|uniref:Uncharacterized protein n=1 Tax=Lichenifustis flavocetrariae TaxID=2949735 RepID=A0AA41Z0J3_9HYPH|nr:hypothetical protein [Lichenifustis flavocetrariae]MCW6510687.1 hypothetical protein [Lichenifustis flavocetrariae]